LFSVVEGKLWPLVVIDQMKNGVSLR